MKDLFMDVTFINKAPQWNICIVLFTGKPEIYLQNHNFRKHPVSIKQILMYLFSQTFCIVCTDGTASDPEIRFLLEILRAE